MFFNLSQEPRENFSHHHHLPNGLIISTDDGWQTHSENGKHILMKGYANSIPVNKLTKHLVDETIPTIKGNFCAFVSDSNTTKMMHDTNRSFPLWIDKDRISNLSPLSEQIWADCLLSVDKSFSITKKYYQPYTKDTNNWTDDKIVDNIHQTILETYEQFLTHNTKPLKIFLSGGLDTTTSWAYLDYFTSDYEVVDYEYMKYTSFYKRNSATIKKHWGYQQIHLWDHDCVLVTGSNGDENFLRGPYTLAMMLKDNKIDLADILKKDDYHYWYLSKKDISNSIDQWYTETDDIQDWILNRNINDHQHWHLDKTITFTPFKDIDILSLILTISKELLIQQAKTGEINRQLIRKIDPNKLNKISRQKNLNHMEHV